jgi:outer membrane protein assembly factor BamB
MPDVSPENSSSEDLPELKADLEETRQLLDRLEGWKAETGEVSLRKEKLRGQLSEALNRARRWSKRTWACLNEWLGGVSGLNQTLFGRGAAFAAFLLLAVGWFQGTFGQVQGTSEQVEYSPMFKGGVARTGAYSGSGPQEKPETQWRFETGSLVDSSPAVANGVVYVGSTDGNLCAVDARTGNLQWSFDAGFMVVSSPAIADETVYVGGGDGNLYALSSRTGNPKWSFKTGAMVRSSPAVAGGTVYVGSNDGNLYAVDTKTGGEKWSFKTGGAVHSSPAVFGGTAYVGSDDGNLYAVNARTGDEKWSFETGAAVRSSPAVASGTVYVGSDNSTLYAIGTQTGNKQWGFGTGEKIRSSPAVASGTVYFGADDGILKAVDAQTGKEQWDFELKAGITNEIRSSPVVVDENIYIGNNNGNLYAINAQTGDEQWSIEVGPSVTSSPVVVNGVVYVGTNGLLALEGELPEDKPTAAERPSSDEVPTESDGATPKADRGPSKEALRSVIVASLEEGEVPEAIRGSPMIPTCRNGDVTSLTIIEVGRQQQRLGKTYWPVKVRATGSCTQGSTTCGGVLGECDTITFSDAEAEFGVWKDPYDNWEARALSR